MGYGPPKAPTGNSDLLCRFLAVSDSRTVASKREAAAAISTQTKSAEPKPIYRPWTTSPERSGDIVMVRFMYARRVHPIPAKGLDAKEEEVP
jgi:hypothetical protein